MITKGVITKKSSRGDAANNDAVKKATKKMKKALDEAIRAHEDGDEEETECLLKDIKEDAEFDFKNEELDQLIYTFVESDCSDSDVVKFLVKQGLEIDDLIDCDFSATPLVMAVS